MRNPDGATEIHEFCSIQRGREDQRAGTAVISLPPVAVPGRDPRPSHQTVPVPGTVFRGREVRAEAILSAPAAAARRAMNVQLSPDKTADFGRSEYTDRPGSERNRLISSLP